MGVHRLWNGVIPMKDGGEISVDAESYGPQSQ